MMEDVRFIHLIRPVPYADMFARQLAVRDAVAMHEQAPTVFFLEHTPTITLGRRARREHILADEQTLRQAGVEVVAVDRGGDVTYHGPGQAVVYPILDLNRWQTSVDAYLRALEEVVIRTLATYGLTGERLAGFTGAWVDGAKVAAIGVGVKNWCTWHGLALNVAPNRDHWRMIIPCGIQDKPIAALADLLPSAPSMAEVVHRLHHAFCEVFSCSGMLCAEEFDAHHEQY